jgi:hypothetical protein
MPRIEKTVFISYRRTTVALALAHPAIQATGRLALAPAGLAPASRTVAPAFLWTRNHLIRLQQQLRRRDQS